MLWTKIASFLVVILILSLVIAPAQAEKRVALVIGNGGYEHVTRLPNPPNDAADVASTLQRLGFTVQQMNDVGRNALRDALAEFSNAAMGADIAVVYYAGHGLEMDRQNYLIPVDAKLATDLRVRFEAVPLDDVLGALDGVKGLRIVMLDACRNNPFLASMKITTANRAISRGLSRVEPSVGTLVSFSAKEGTEAADGTAHHSPYTTALLANLDRPGVEINKLFRLVRDDVLAATGGAQEPYTYGSTSGQDLFFKPTTEGSSSSAPPANSADPTAADFQLAKDVDTQEAWDAFLARHGSEAGNFFVDLAKAARQKLALNVPLPPKIEPDKTECDGTLLAATGGAGKCLKPGDEFSDCEQCPKMVVIPAGSFTMGSPMSEKDRSDDEGPQHKVTIEHPFAVGKFEVTFDEWDACVEAGGCGGYRPDDEGWGRGARPVINVSWNNVKSYLEWLSKQAGARYRLLSEAEWEYAARAGTTTAFSTGKTLNMDQANLDGRFSYNGSREGKWRRQTINVGSFAANAFGLYDMHGNVWEWTEDCHHDSYQGAPTDGSPWTTGVCEVRVFRGGSWDFYPGILRSAVRSHNSPDQTDNDWGFRVARAGSL